jgi:LytS/YehU family sensor histidine kinase
LILQNSRSNYVNLRDEIEALDLYMNMESLRFRNTFDYKINIGEELDVDSIDVPPMLIQPYIENAIWHGLMHKKEGAKGMVQLNLSRQNGSLRCFVEDNGIGREKAMEINARKITKRKKSMGMRITHDRIQMINKMFDSKTSVEIIDLKNNIGEAIGTRVELYIPI